jgi:AcrR family transcriptional regulator
MSHHWDMNMSAPRQYRMTARAAQVVETGERIVAAALELYDELWLDEITLDKVAERAGVSTKTLHRRYGDRDGLLRSVSETLAGRVAAQRFDARPGDIDDAVANLVTHYEAVGTLALRNMIQAQRFPQIAALVEYGRDEHRRWVRHVFARWLEPPGDTADGDVFLQLFTITDVTVWRLLRSDLRLDPQQTRHIIRGLLVAVIGEEPT